MRISDWSSDVCSSDLGDAEPPAQPIGEACIEIDLDQDRHRQQRDDQRLGDDLLALKAEQQDQRGEQRHQRYRSEEHTSELQSLMRISYAVFCLKKKKSRRTQYRHVIYKS